MTRSEYEARRRRLDEELRAVLEAVQAGHQARVQLLDLMWGMASTGTPEPEATPPAAPLFSPARLATSADRLGDQPLQSVGVLRFRIERDGAGARDDTVPVDELPLRLAPHFQSQLRPWLRLQIKLERAEKQPLVDDLSPEHALTEGGEGCLWIHARNRNRPRRQSLGARGV